MGLGLGYTKPIPNLSPDPNPNPDRWEPFVAFIVGSYDLRLPGPHSKLQAFVVRTQQGQPTPFEVTFGAPVEEAPLGDDTLQVLLLRSSCQT